MEAAELQSLLGAGGATLVTTAANVQIAPGAVLHVTAVAKQAPRTLAALQVALRPGDALVDQAWVLDCISAHTVLGTAEYTPAALARGVGVASGLGKKKGGH